MTTKEMNKEDLLIVGAGPVGLSTALFLENKANITIIDKLTERVPFSKAFGVSPRTLELLENTGATELFLKNGRKLETLNIYKNGKLLIKNEINRVNHKYPFMLVQSQADSEEIMTNLLQKRGIEIQRGIELNSIKIDKDKIISEVKTLNGNTDFINSNYILASDGATSTTRKHLALSFDGNTLSDMWQVYDLEIETQFNNKEAHIFMYEVGALFMVRIKNNIWRIISNIPEILTTLPKNTTHGAINWNSEFKISHRIIGKFEQDNIFFAGDSAHIHSGLGARGMNLGIEDAYVFSKLFKESRLNEYETLRKPIVLNTLSRIENLTEIMQGKTTKAKIFRKIAPIIMPIMFPLVRTKILNFVLGLDHKV
jgi:2-polyprenyl-6-methoxyphenol hydroxylase-like FAD-dependent oxidoreductase